MRNRTTRRGLGRSGWLLLVGAALSSRPCAAVELGARGIPTVPALVPSIQLSVAPIGLPSAALAASVMPAALSVARSPIAEIPTLAPAAVSAVAPAPQAVAAAATGPAGRAEAAPASEASAKASVLAGLEQGVAALSRPDARPERELSRIFEGEAAASARMGSPKMATLDDAIALATKAHMGQTDKAGAPYLGHLTRVMGRMKTDEEKMVGVLHDIVEDTPVTLDDLRAEGFPEPVVAAVDSLTHRKGETYAQFVERVKLNPLARKVKMADLEDNMNLGRLPNPQPKDFERVEKYRKYWLELAALESGKAAGEPVFQYFAVVSNGQARGLFVFNRAGSRMDMLAFNHQSKRWEHDPRYVSRYFTSDLDAEPVSRAKAEEIARGFGVVVPSEPEFMRISDEAEARLRSEKK